MPVEWLAEFVTTLADAAGTELFVVKGVLAILLVCSMCGMLGSMVVGHRMAFFSDAMAHCAFAGVSIGYLSVLLQGWDRDTASWVVPLAMIAFGAVVGVGIVYVRDQTGLGNDTVIGVFFALAIGFGAMVFQALSAVSALNPEHFLFGNLVLIPEEDLLYLIVLVIVATPLFAWRYNQFVFASFNPTLARTRGLAVNLNNYLFILILALVVNLSIKAVGALLINAMLVVPAATAANLSRNLRQMFWLSVLFCVGAGLVGFALRNNFEVRLGRSEPVQFGASGLIVVTSVLMFFGSMLFAAVWNRFAPALGLSQLPLHRKYHAHGENCIHDQGLGNCS